MVRLGRKRRELKPVQSDRVEQYPNLRQVLGGYLHQDFDLDFESPDAALRDAAQGQGPQQVGGAVQEINELLASDLESRQLTEIVERLTAGYSPVLDGWEIRDWLQHARTILRTGIA
ncbi:MAG: contact-dependent growth inhibition system immunity protein [Actinomycetota bacterium]